MAPELDLITNPIEDFKMEVKYAASPDEHEANVRAAVALKLPSLQRGPLATEPVAVVCSGPSLRRIWKQIKDFKHILTCSGAHQFLLDHGIVPTWHMEGDPRAHKAVFVRWPHRRVQYLIASSCHPKVFQALKGYNVKVWHVLQNAEHLITLGHYPAGDWVLTGGTNVGMRALVMARILGFTDVHVFGMDCSAEESFHTGNHPNEPTRETTMTVRIGERAFQSTPLFVHYAQQFFHEILQLPDVHVQLHGDGLLQALAKWKISDPEQLAAWLAQRENVINTTIAVVERGGGG